MGCDCARSTTPDLFINTFWAELKIREITKEDIIKNIQAKKGRGKKKIGDLKFNQFIENNVENPNYHEESMKLFQAALEESRNKDEGYFFLSMLFLSKPEYDIQTFVTKFVSMWKDYVSVKGSLIEASGDKKAAIKTENLKDLMKFYVNMISYLGVPFITNKSDDKAFIIDFFKTPFGEDKRKQFINNQLFYNFNEEQTDLEDFFIDNLAHLQDDVYIRDKLLQQS